MPYLPPPSGPLPGVYGIPGVTPGVFDPQPLNATATVKLHEPLHYLLLTLTLDDLRPANQSERLTAYDLLDED